MRKEGNIESHTFKGLPTIATNWSGNTEFMTAKNSYLIEVEGLVNATVQVGVTGEGEYRGRGRVSRKGSEGEFRGRGRGPFSLLFPFGNIWRRITSGHNQRKHIFVL